MSQDHRYRIYSSAWTGRAPRTMADRWLDHPVTVRNSVWRRLLIWFCGF